MSFHSRPFPHWVLEDVAPAGLVEAAARDWPAPDWPGWVTYDGPHQAGKRAAHDWHELPSACYQLLDRLLALPVPALTGARCSPDGGLWGAGLHEIPEGGRLGPHLDADRHPRTGRRRLFTAVLFLGAGAGGGLELLDRDRRAGAAIPPFPGRAVLFANTDWAWHRVAPWQGPGGRKTATVFWYGEPVPEASRPRALFAIPQAR